MLGPSAKKGGATIKWSTRARRRPCLPPDLFRGPRPSNVGDFEVLELSRGERDTVQLTPNKGAFCGPEKLTKSEQAGIHTSWRNGEVSTKHRRQTLRTQFASKCIGYNPPQSGTQSGTQSGVSHPVSLELIEGAVKRRRKLPISSLEVIGSHQIVTYHSPSPLPPLHLPPPSLIPALPSFTARSLIPTTTKTDPYTPPRTIESTFSVLRGL